VSVLVVTRQRQKSEAVAIAAQGYAQDLSHSLQGARRARVAGRLLSEPGRLVVAERSYISSRFSLASGQLLYVLN